MTITFRNTETVRRSYSKEHGVLLAETQWAEEAHEGLVLDTGSRSTRIMSDVWGTCYYATVWNPEAGEPRDVHLRTVDHGMGYSSERVSRAWRDWHSTATVDATDEVKAAHEAYQAAERERKRLQEFEANVAEGVRKASEVVKGSFVEVFKGRKVPVGTTGECFWVGAGNYGYRVGVRGEADGETYWTALDNVRVVAGYENWDNTCPDCGGAGWLPAYDGNGGTVHCDECTARYEAYQAKRKAEQEAERARYEERSEVGLVKGAKVEVVSEGNRNDAPVGTTGKVFWVGPNKYGPGDRLGFKVNGETYWANAENCKAA